MIKKKDMQEEGWTDMREMKGMNEWAACIADRRWAAVRRAVVGRHDRSPDKLFLLSSNSRPLVKYPMGHMDQ